MNKKSFAILAFLALLFILPAVFSSSYCHACTTMPSQNNRCCEPLKLTGQEYKCVNCYNGLCDLKLYYYYNWASESPKIESLGRVSACDNRCAGTSQDCSNNSAPTVSISVGRIVPAPRPDNRIVDWYECRTVNGKSYSYNIITYPSQPSRISEIPKYCPYGCSTRTMKCNPAPVQPAPKYEWRCSADGKYRIWFDYVNNEESRREKCLFGKICSNGACIVPAIVPPKPIQPTQPSQPSTKTKCETRWLFWQYSVTRDTETNKELSKEYCKNGCDKTTGRCKAESQGSQSTSASNRVFCNANNKIVLIEVTYGNGEKRVRNKTICGSCQTCVEVRGVAQCQGSTSGTCTTTSFNLSVTTNNTQSSPRTYYYTNNRASTGSSSSYNSGSSSSNYNSNSSSSSNNSTTHYRTYSSSSTQRPGISTSTYSRNYRRSYEDSWNPVEQECTANSDCYHKGTGYKCSFEENGNFCRRG